MTGVPSQGAKIKMFCTKNNDQIALMRPPQFYVQTGKFLKKLELVEAGARGLFRGPGLLILGAAVFRYLPVKPTKEVVPRKLTASCHGGCINLYYQNDTSLGVAVCGL